MQHFQFYPVDALDVREYIMAADDSMAHLYQSPRTIERLDVVANL